jgi:hypothetical protein
MPLSVSWRVPGRETDAGKGGYPMFSGPVGTALAIGLFVLVVALIYAVLHIRHRRKILARESERLTARQIYTGKSSRAGEAGSHPPTHDDIA